MKGMKTSANPRNYPARWRSASQARRSTNPREAEPDPGSRGLSGDGANDRDAVIRVAAFQDGVDVGS